MIFTGERYLPEIGGHIRAEHMHRYRLAYSMAAGKDVLDVACGEGYGSSLLARVARSVTGVDIAAEAIEHAIGAYHQPHLKFLVGDCANLPCADASFDLVVSFETIEHHDRHEEMLREIRRVLRPDGVLMISSPNRPVYDATLTEPNPYHVKELDFDEFAGLLQAHFAHVTFYGQRVLGGSLIVPTDATRAEFSYFAEDMEASSLPNPVYFVALASDGPLPTLGISIQTLDALPPASASPNVVRTEARLYISERIHDQITPFSESRGAACQYDISGERMTLTLDLPGDVRPLARLRFDPASAPVAISLHRLTLGDASGRELWRWQGDETALTNLLGAAFRQTSNGPCLFCYTDDPQFELALPETILQQVGPGASLVVEMTPQNLMGALPELFKAAAPTALSPIQAGSFLPDAHRFGADLVEMAQLMKTVIERRNATIADQRSELASLRASNRALETQVRRAEAQLDVLKEFVLAAFGKANARI